VRIALLVKPKAREESLEEFDAPSGEIMRHFRVAVKEPPVQGRANWRIVSMIAKHFNVSVDSVRIVSGVSSKKKVIEISE
jgi:uncharacterized protein